MRVEKPLRRRFGRKLACVQHVAGVTGGGGGGGGGRKKRRGEEKKGKGVGERRKGTPAVRTPFCSPLQTPASANCDWLIRQ